MKIVINKTEAAIYAAGKMLIPGTNVLDSFDAKNASVEAFVKNGDLVVADSATIDAETKKLAGENVTTKENSEKLKAAVKGVDTSKADKKIDELEEQLKKAH